MKTSPLQSELFTSVDTAWLRMDTPTNLAIITGVMVFTAPLDFERLRVTIEARLLPFKRFRQRVREPKYPLLLPRWEYDPHFDISYHLQRGKLPEPGDHATMQLFVSELMSLPLDRSRPLWQIYYVENYLKGSAIVARLHHCIADGIAIMQVLLSLTDATAQAPWPEPFEPHLHPMSPLARLVLPVVRTIYFVDRTMKSAENLVHEGMETLIHPSRLQKFTQRGISGSLALGKLLLIPPDHPNILKQKCGIAKKAAWSTAFNIEEVKEVGRLMGGTVNDILLSAITGALRRYLDESGPDTPPLDIRAIVPVNLRPEEELVQLGNRFGLVYLSLPVGIRDPIKRLVVLKQRMNAIKRSPEAVVALGILNVIGLTPIQVERIIVTIFGMKCTLVMTNVPGPRQALYLAGEPIKTMMFWVPSPSNLSLGISILSYAGEVILGVATDASVVPDPEQIISLFQEEFLYLQNWGRPQKEMNG